MYETKGRRYIGLFKIQLVYFILHVTQLLDVAPFTHVRAPNFLMFRARTDYFVHLGGIDDIHEPSMEDFREKLNPWHTPHSNTTKARAQCFCTCLHTEYLKSF